MSDFRKHWLNELKENDFISSDKMSKFDINVGEIKERNHDNFLIRFSSSGRYADVHYDTKNGVFFAIKESNLPYELPDMVGDKIYIPSQNDVQDFISEQFYIDGLNMLDSVAKRFKKTFNPTTGKQHNNDSRYSVMAAICNLNREILR